MDIYKIKKWPIFKILFYFLYSCVIAPVLCHSVIIKTVHFVHLKYLYRTVLLYLLQFLCHCHLPMFTPITSLTIFHAAEKKNKSNGDICQLLFPSAIHYASLLNSSLCKTLNTHVPSRLPTKHSRHNPESSASNYREQLQNASRAHCSHYLNSVCKANITYHYALSHIVWKTRVFTTKTRVQSMHI